MIRVVDDSSVRTDVQVQSGCFSPAALPPVTNRGYSLRSSVSGGLDWVDLSVWGKWLDASDGALPDALKKSLKSLVLDANVSKGPVCWRCPGGQELTVLPRTFGMRGHQVVAVLQSSWGRLSIWDTSSDRAGWAQAWITVPGTPCLQHGGENCVQYWRDVLDSLGFGESRNSVRRLDWCVDQPGVSPGAYHKALNGREYSCRGKANQHGMLDTGWTGELGNPKMLQVKMYDKRREASAKESSEPGYVQMLRGTRWPAEVGPDFEAVRVEVKMMGDWLKRGTSKFSINSFEDWCNHRAAVLSYVVGEYCVLRTVAPDRVGRHYDKGEVMPEWLEVQRAVSDLCGPDAVERLPQRVRNVASDGFTDKMLYAYAVSSFVSQFGGDPDEVDDRVFRKWVWSYIMNLFHDRDENGSESVRIGSLVKARRVRLGAAREVVETPF